MKIKIFGGIEKSQNATLSNTAGYSYQNEGMDAAVTGSATANIPAQEFKMGTFGKSASPSAIDINGGETLTYTLTYEGTNQLGTAVFPITFTDELPADLPAGALNLTSVSIKTDAAEEAVKLSASDYTVSGNTLTYVHTGAVTARRS